MVGAEGALDERPNVSAGRQKDRICLPPSRVCPFFQPEQGIEVGYWVTLIRRLHRLTRRDKGWASHVGCNPS